jgi:hypothetical protein
MIRVLRETHEAPEAVAARLAWAGGLNRFGEGNYRVVWGWNRLAWIGGKFEDRDEHGELLREVVELRQEPKYGELNRWHVERWVAPEAYGSPRQWIVERVAQAIEWSRQIPRGKKREGLYEREARGDRRYEAWAYDVLDDGAPALHGQPFVTVG